MKTYKFLFPALLFVLVYLTSCRHITDPDDDHEHHHHGKDTVVVKDTLVIIDSLNPRDTAVIFGHIELRDYMRQSLGVGAGLLVEIYGQFGYYQTTISDSNGDWKITNGRVGDWCQVVVKKNGFVPINQNLGSMAIGHPYNAGVQSLYTIAPLLTALASTPTITKEVYTYFARDTLVLGSDGLLHNLKIYDSLFNDQIEVSVNVFAPNGSPVIGSCRTGMFLSKQPNIDPSDTSTYQYLGTSSSDYNEDFHKITLGILVDNNNVWQGLLPKSGDTLYLVCAAAYTEVPSIYSDPRGKEHYIFSPHHTTPIQIILP